MVAETTIDRADGNPLEDRIVDAMLVCISRWGITKTTADDIARAAGISRATLYRAFPGGKDVAFEALLHHETQRFFDTVTGRLNAADSLEDLLVVGITGAARFLTEHEALGYVLVHETERVLPVSASQGLDRVIAIATTFASPHLARVVSGDSISADAEWIVRQVLSYAINPSPSVDLTDDGSVRRFVVAYLLPALAGPTDNAPKER